MNSSLYEGISPPSESYQMVMEILAPLVFVCCKNSQGELPYSSEQELTEAFCVSWKVN